MKKSINAQDINLRISDTAANQILLISENDYTLKGHLFRIKIGGKGCEGFTYEAGFSEKTEDDLVINPGPPHHEIKILMDPFTAFYTQELTLDYVFDPQTFEDGFVIKNAAEGSHRGKFFKDESKLPPWAKG